MMTDYQLSEVERAVKDLLQPIIDELAGIREAIEVAFAPPVEEPAPVGCQHPADSRIDFGVTNGVEDWQCKLCDHRSTVT